MAECPFSTLMEPISATSLLECQSRLAQALGTWPADAGTLLTSRERDALDAAPDGILLVHRDGRIVAANAAMLAISGYERHELEAQALDILLPEESRSTHGAYLSSYFAQPARRPMGMGGSLWLQRKQGGAVPVDIALGHFGDENNSLAVAFVRDVTELNQMQQRLKFQATRDTLTGLHNRWQFGQELQEQLKIAQEGAMPWPCCSWIWTTSRPSMTATATRQATNCCAKLRGG